MSTTMAKLVTKKRELLQRLEQNPGPDERAEIEQLQAKINAALELLNDGGSEREYIQAFPVQHEVSCRKLFNRSRQYP
jgi:hypothetical protein